VYSSFGSMAKPPEETGAGGVSVGEVVPKVLDPVLVHLSHGDQGTNCPQHVKAEQGWTLGHA